MKKKRASNLESVEVVYSLSKFYEEEALKELESFVSSDPYKLVYTSARAPEMLPETIGERYLIFSKASAILRDLVRLLNKIVPHPGNPVVLENRDNDLFGDLYAIDPDLNAFEDLDLLSEDDYGDSSGAEGFQ